MEIRQIRGMEIAKQKQSVRKSGEGWLVKSQSGEGGFYKVDEMFNCNCPDAQFHKATCKHAYALRYYLQAENTAGEVVHKQRLTYRQAWHAYNQAQTSEGRLFGELLKDLVQGIEEPVQEMGRPRLALREQVFCAIQKVYSQLSSRRAASLYFNSKERGQLTRAPNFNAINKFLNREDLSPVLHELIAVTAAPLKAIETKFAVDSTGFSTSQFGAYCNEKHNLGLKHEFVKCHAICGTQTNIIAGVEVTRENGADCPQFPVLIQKTANGGFTVAEVSADKGYSGRSSFVAAAAVGATAYIPFKSNATGRADGSLLWRKAFHYFQLNQDEFYQHYHARSNIESTFGAIKKKFGDTLKSKNPKAQENELLCKLIAYNVTVLINAIFELGIKPDFSQKPLENYCGQVFK